ncbi:MAG: type VI secretion system baseplate subunit TssF [Chromatiales bacterium]|nr:type VI secretion system baseplate subunit TssF [Chromatiales bacterium]
MAQFQPDLNEADLAARHRHSPRQRACAACSARASSTACEFRTAHDVTLWPLEIVERRVLLLRAGSAG